jgi:hypothetical protein
MLDEMSRVLASGTKCDHKNCLGKHKEELELDDAVVLKFFLISSVTMWRGLSCCIMGLNK